MAGSGNRNVYFQHDVHQAQHRRVPATPGGSAALQVDDLGQHGHHCEYVKCAILVGCFPVQSGSRAVGLHDPKSHVRINNAGCQRCLRSFCLEHTERLALRAASYPHAMEGDDVKTCKGHCLDSFEPGSFVSLC